MHFVSTEMSTEGEGVVDKEWFSPVHCLHWDSPNHALLWRGELEE